MAKPGCMVTLYIISKDLMAPYVLYIEHVKKWQREKANSIAMTNSAASRMNLIRILGKLSSLKSMAKISVMLSGTSISSLVLDICSGVQDF